MQQHGFARNLEWSIASSSANPNPDDPDPTVELVLSENDYTLKMCELLWGVAGDLLCKLQVFVCCLLLQFCMLCFAVVRLFVS